MVILFYSNEVVGCRNLWGYAVCFVLRFTIWLAEVQGWKWHPTLCRV